jgi:hypothetical protein
MRARRVRLRRGLAMRLERFLEFVLTLVAFAVFGYGVLFAIG